MVPRIETLPFKRLVGYRMTMSLTKNKTCELWNKFMSHRKEITNSIGTELFSIQLLDTSYYQHFNPDNEFEKWAASEVNNFNSIPAGMEPMTLTGGLYAVFLHKGAANTGPKTFQYIFQTWLPGSAYLVDNRPHFEILGEGYKNDHPDSEEEIWIPIKHKD
jgi:AraC family transcriptional regulator